MEQAVINAALNKAKARVNAQASPIVFNGSQIKYGLWKPVECSKNGEDNSSGELLLRLFILNGDAGKSLEAANAALALGDQLDLTGKFTLIAAKPIVDEKGEKQELAQKVRLTVTGAEVRARAAAIVALAETERETEVLYQAPESKVKAKKGSLAAGLAK